MIKDPIGKISSTIRFGNQVYDGYQLVNGLIGQYRERKALSRVYYKLQVTDDDAAWAPLRRMMFELTPENPNQTSWNVRAGTNQLRSNATLRAEYEPVVVSKREATVRGAKVSWKITVDAPMPGTEAGDAPIQVAGGKIAAAPQVLTIYADTRADLDKVREELDSRLEKIAFKANPPTVATFGRYGWDYNRSPLRSLDTVVLDREIKDPIVSDIEEFLASEQRYVDLGLPWHRGLLLYGPPGTGKTSLVKGLAYRFRMDIYSLSLSAIENDDELVSRVSEIGRKHILLLEDVDSVQAAVSREDSDDEKRVTTSGLLNVLDGLSTPHGCVAILTTNYRNRIDPAVLRPGRVDRQVYLGYASSWQANELHHAFYGSYPAIEFQLEDWMEITTASIIEILKTHLDDPIGGALAVHELINDKLAHRWDSAAQAA